LSSAGSTAGTTQGLAGLTTDAMSALTAGQLKALNAAQLSTFNQQQVNSLSSYNLTMLNKSGYITIVNASETGIAGVVPATTTLTTNYVGTTASVITAAPNKALNVGTATDTSTVDGVIDTVTAGTSTVNETIVGSTKADIIAIGDASDSIEAGAGNDSIVLTNHTALHNSTIDGGTGTDTLTIKTPASTILATDFANVSGIEILALNGTATAALGADFANSGITTIVGTSAVDALTFSGAAVDVTVHTGGGADTFALSPGYANSITIGTDAWNALGTATAGDSDVVTGNTGADSVTFTTGIGASGSFASIDGAAGDDIITLKDGATDYASIKGGAGADTIVLGASHAGAIKVAIDATAATDADTITNFIHGSAPGATAGDLVQLGATGTTAVTAKTVAFVGESANMIFDTSSNLGTNGVNIANYGSNPQVNYAVASDTGAIYYDADGNWSAGSVQVGSVGVVNGLLSSDFNVNVTSANTNATVLATNMTSTQIAQLVTDVANLASTSITGTISLTVADEHTLTAALNTSAVVTVSDTGAHIVGGLANLASEVSKIDTISQTDTSAMSMTVADEHTLTGVLTAADNVNIADTSSHIAGGTANITADIAKIDTITPSDAATEAQAATFFGFTNSGVTTVILAAGESGAASMAINAGDVLNLHTFDGSLTDAAGVHGSSPVNHEWNITSGHLYVYTDATHKVDITLTGTATSATSASGVLTFA